LLTVSLIDENKMTKRQRPFLAHALLLLLLLPAAAPAPFLVLEETKTWGKGKSGDEKLLVLSAMTDDIIPLPLFFSISERERGWLQKRNKVETTKSTATGPPAFARVQVVRMSLSAH